MFRWCILALGLVWASYGFAQNTGDSAAIERTIQNQMEAFQARDPEAAFEYASPMIKGMFGTPETFGTMVEQGYPMVWNNAEVRYLDLREVAGRLWQQVMVRDADGKLHMLDYQMIETEEGWQINGVQLLPMPGLGA
ncbi:DUF4864 domain-containing protein [Aestuariibius insulae]|uniref:DUF4864 domain-containing protein n=1 Tax=Aestuariibius insulae TaxID=2058287 RepID=UPI00345F1031